MHQYDSLPTTPILQGHPNAANSESGTLLSPALSVTQKGLSDEHVCMLQTTMTVPRVPAGIKSAWKPKHKLGVHSIIHHQRRTMETLVRNYIELAREDPIDLADFRAFKEQIPTEPAADRSVAAEWDMIRHLLDAPIQEIKSVHWAMEDVRAAAVRIELCLDKELSPRSLRRPSGGEWFPSYKAKLYRSIGRQLEMLHVMIYRNMEVEMDLSELLASIGRLRIALSNAGQSDGKLDFAAEMAAIEDFPTCKALWEEFCRFNAHFRMCLIEDLSHKL